MVIYMAMAAAVQTAAHMTRDRRPVPKVVTERAVHIERKLGWRDALVVIGFALVVAVFMLGAWKLGLL
jgi:hypothetical protein